MKPKKSQYRWYPNRSCHKCGGLGFMVLREKGADVAVKCNCWMRREVGTVRPVVRDGKALAAGGDR